MIGSRGLLYLFLAFALQGCGRTPQTTLPAGPAAYSVIPVKAENDELNLIRPGDRLYVVVVGEPELTSDKYQVDAAGDLQVPLAGVVRAGGLNLAALRTEIEQRLGQRYIRDPHVAISIVERNSTVFAVEGEVREPGVFEVRPDTTLLGAIAQAKSPSQVARLDEIFVFRQINGQRAGARFNLKEIRNGTAQDPQILPGDTVVVGFSHVKGAWRDLLQAAPLFNLFYLLR